MQTDEKPSELDGKLCVVGVKADDDKGWRAQAGLEVFGAVDNKKDETNIT